MRGRHSKNEQQGKMADEGLAKKDRICQFFASNAGLHFRSVDVAAALGLDARSVGQQLARLWRSGFVEKVQTGPFTTWRMKFQTYPGRNLHGPAAPKPAGLTQHTPAKKSTRGSRTHEEGRNDSGHCAMGSSVVFGSTEGGNQEGEEEEDETEDQGSCLVEAHSVRVPEYHSSSSKPPAATRDRPTSTQNISSQCKAAENPLIKKTVGRPPGNKNKMSTSCRVGQEGTKTGKTSLTLGSCKKTTSAPVKRRVGPESFRNADKGSRLKGKKKTSQSKEDCSSRSGTDSESTSQKIVPTGLKRKLGLESKYPDQGLKKKVKKTRTQTTGREDCRGRSATDSGLSTLIQKKTQLVPASVSCQKHTATAVKKKTGQGQKRRMKTTTSPNTEGYCSSTQSTSGKESLQHNPSPMPATLAPSLNRPSGNMETKLMNFIHEAQGMLVMTGDDVAKALGSKPKETHRLLLHMQRTGRVRKVCDKPTRWMMLGQGKGGPARKRQSEATTTTQQKELPSLTSTKQKEPPQTKHQELSTQIYRRLSVDGSLVRRRQVEATTTTQQKELPPLTKHQLPSTQTYRSLSSDGSSEEGTSKTRHSDTDVGSECSQNGQRLAHHMSTCEEEEEDSEEIVSTSTQVSAAFGTCLATVEEEDLEDFSCVSQEEDSGFLDDVTFYAERKKSSPTVQQASSLPSKKQNKTSNQKSLVTTATRRSLSPCGKYVKKTPVKKQVLTDCLSVRMSTENGSSYTKPTAAKSTSLGNLQSQNSNHTRVSSTSWQGKKGLSNFRIPKKNSLSGKHLGKSQFTVGQKSGDLCGGKRMSVAPSKLDNNLLDSSKDCTDKNTQKDISTIKTPPHILKHSVSYFASTTKKPNTKPKLPRPSKTTKDIPKSQEKRETSFVRAKDNAISTKEPLADIDVVVDVTVDKSPQIQNQLHSCGTCSSNQDLQHTPLSVLRRNSTKTTHFEPPKLYPQRATESIGKQCMVGTLGSCDSPPILVHEEEELRSLGTESLSLRAARRNLYPCFSLEEGLDHQQKGTSCLSIPEQSGFKEFAHTGFRRGLVENDAYSTHGSEYNTLTDTDTKTKQQQLTACPHDWLLNKVNDRKIAGRCGGQKNVSGLESFSSEIGGTKESFSSFQDTGTDPRRTIGRGVYAEIQDTSRVTGGEVIGHAGHGSRQSTFTNLHEEQHGRGHACNQEERRSNTAANLNSLEPRKDVSKASIGRMGSFIPMEVQHGMTNIDDRAHHMATNPSCSQGLIGNNRQADLNSLEPGKTVSKARPGEKASYSPKEQHRMTDINDGAHHIVTDPGCGQGLIGNNRQGNLNSLEPRKDVAKTSIGGIGSFISTKQDRMANIDGRAHHMGPVLGAEQSVRHPLGYHRTDHTCSVHQMDNSGQGGDRRHLGRPQKPEKVHQALAPTEAGCFEVPAPHEVPRMSVGGCEEKLVRGTIDLTQEKFTKASWPHPTDYWCDGVQDVFHAKDRKLYSDTEELLTTSTYTASEAEARKCISSTKETVPHTTTAYTASDNILPAKVRNLLFGTEKAVPDITSMHTASEDVFPAIARRLSPGAEETVPHRTVTHIARSNVGHPSKSDNVSFLEEQALRAKVSNSPAQNGTLCKVYDTPLRNLERVTSTSGAGALVTSHVIKSMQPSYDCSTNAKCKGAPIQATRSHTGSAPVLGADQHAHCIGVKQSPVNPEGLCISEKSQQSESTKWQRPRSPKSFWIDYWSKVELKDTKSDDRKYRSAEDVTVLNDRLVAYSNTNAENTDSKGEPSSDFMKNYSQSKVCANEVLCKDNTNLRDEKSLTVAKKEPKIFRTTETQTSETFVRTSQVQTEGFVDLRGDSQMQDLHAGSVDVKVSLEEREGSAVSSLTGPIEQSSWTQPKALYATVDRRPQEEKRSEVQEPSGQEVMDEAKVDDRSHVQVEPRGQEETVRDKVTSHEGSEVDPRGQEEAAGDNTRGRDGSEVGQVSRNQVSVAMVTPQGNRPVVMSAQPSDTSLHPAPPVPVSQQSHPIVQLNELCQRNHLPMCFQDISVTGPSHRPRVQVAAVVGDCTFQAEASSKKAARRQAAREALQALYREGYK